MASPATPRACESCRLLKVRCSPGGPEGSTSTCLRCAATGKTCLYTAPRRTRRKRTDVRVRELEQEMAVLNGLLRVQRNGDSLPRELAASVQHQPVSYTPSTTSAPPSFSSQNDPIALGLVSPQEAAVLFQLYTQHLAPQRPLVVFSSPSSSSTTTTPEHVRSTQSTLFLAVLAAAAGTRDEALGIRLNEMILSVYADKIMLQGEKSLEIVQAILVTTNWYCPLHTYDRLKFYQFVHIAATMCIDIGLGERGVDENVLDDAPGGRLDCCRTVLACYICCSSISLNFHRPNMFPFTHDVSECLAALESPARSPVDAQVAAWTRLQKIVDDDSARALGLRENSKTVDLSTSEVQESLQECKNKLQMWKMSVPAETMTNPLLVQYHATTCLVNEVGLHLEYSPDDFKPPYSIYQPESRTRPPLSPTHLGCIINCVSAAQSLCDVFISLSTASIQCFPVAAYARLGYVLVVLTKVSASILSPNGALFGVMAPEMTQAGELFAKVTWKLRAVAESGCRVAGKWLEIIDSMAVWFGRLREAVSGGHVVDLGILEPLKKLNNVGTNGGQDQSTQPGQNIPSPRAEYVLDEGLATQFEEMSPVAASLGEGLVPFVEQGRDEFASVPMLFGETDFYQHLESASWTGLGCDFDDA